MNTDNCHVCTLLWWWFLQAIPAAMTKDQHNRYLICQILGILQKLPATVYTVHAQVLFLPLWPKPKKSPTIPAEQLCHDKQLKTPQFLTGLSLFSSLRAMWSKITILWIQHVSKDHAQYNLNQQPPADSSAECRHRFFKHKSKTMTD